MVKKVTKSSDGMYHVKGKKFQVLIGSRAQVWHSTAYKTAGGLTKSDLHMNKHGRIVSRKKHTTAKAEKRLEKHGFFTRKGHFGAVRRDGKKSAKKSAKKHSKGKSKTRRRR